LYIRCVDCKATTLIQHIQLGSSASARLTCGTCGRRYDVEDTSGLGATQREGYENAQAFATEEDIDLPAAYSVLLGIVTVDQARALRAAAKKKRAPPPPPTAAPPEDDAASAAPPTDEPLPAPEPPGPNVEAPAASDDAVLGDLAAALDTPSSDRAGSPPAPDLADRYPDPPPSPHRNASPRTSPSASFDTGAEATSPSRIGFPELTALQRVAIKPERRESPAPTIDASAVEPASPEPEPDVPPGISGATVSKNEAGEPTAITGDDPLLVLVAYCAAAGRIAGASELVPVELAATVPPSPDARIGVFTSTAADAAPATLLIRRDPASGRWTTGDGVVPVDTAPLDEVATGEPRTPLSGAPNVAAMTDTPADRAAAAPVR
jgi:hypothetical protein